MGGDQNNKELATRKKTKENIEIVACSSPSPLGLSTKTSSLTWARTAIQSLLERVWLWLSE